MQTAGLPIQPEEPLQSQTAGLPAQPEDPLQQQAVGLPEQPADWAECQPRSGMPWQRSPGRT